MILGRKLIISTIFILVSSSCLINASVAPSEFSAQNPLITQMISKTSETEIHTRTYQLQNFTTRAYWTDGNVNASAYLHSRLSNISRLTVEYQGGSFRNVIATLPGTDGTSNAIYMAGAHYDSYSPDPRYAPGATDNGGGVAIVLEFARIMSQYYFNHTLKFAFWNAEENGAQGSNNYAKYARDNSLNVSLYENFDSSCYDPNNQFVLDIMYNANSAWVSDMMTQYNSLYGIGFTLTYNVHSCVSDHRSFWTYGYTAIMTHEETHGPAHTINDTIDKVSTLYAKKNCQLGMSILAELAEVRASSVGGVLVPVNKLRLLSPYIAFASIVVAIVTTAFCVRRAKQRKEK